MGVGGPFDPDRQVQDLGVRRRIVKEFDGLMTLHCDVADCVSSSQEDWPMPDDFEYISRARLEYQGGYRYAYLGEVAEPVIYGVQGALREYYGAKEGPPIASTLDHIVGAVAG